MATALLDASGHPAGPTAKTSLGWYDMSRGEELKDVDQTSKFPCFLFDWTCRSQHTTGTPPGDHISVSREVRPTSDLQRGLSGL